MDELRDYDPTQEGGGGPCERCGYEQDPWRFSRLCQACIWDDQASRSEAPAEPSDVRSRGRNDP